MNDDSVKTVVYKSQQAAKQFAEVFHRSSPPSLVLTTRSWIRRPVGINTWMILPPGRWLPIPGSSKFQILYLWLYSDTISQQQVGQTIVFRGLSCLANARLDRRHKPIVCPTSYLASV